VAVRRRVVIAGITVLAAACGARTGLLAPELPPEDAKADVRDAARDSREDVSDAVFPDVPIIGDCPDAGATLVYVLGAAAELYSFYPPTLAFNEIGTIACPSTSTPNSMAVTRTGIAFTGFHDGNLFEVSTANAACKKTTFVPDQHMFLTLGMGYADIADGGESLFVADQNGGFSKNLGIIDTTAFTLDLVGPLQPEQSQCELTGTGGGRLFGFCPSQTASSLVEIDPQTAVVISSHPLSVSIPSTYYSYAFAFAFWGGDFWLFTACNSNSTVTEYDPVAQTETAVATAPLAIVGAGVSTCAPQ